jgi:multiple sugar transport system permease protein
MRKNNVLLNTVVYAVLVLGATIMVFPFLWMISTSLKNGGAVQQIPPEFIPHPVMWHNYAEVWVQVDFLRYTLNSSFLAVFQVVFMLLSCSFVAFGLAMFTFKGKGFLYMTMLGTLMMPFQVTMIPKYMIWKELGLLDTFYPLLIPALLGSAFGIFLIHQYIKGLPIEMYEAAMIDGYNPLGIFWKIYFPLSSPALAALAVLTFMDSWNNMFEPLLYLKNKVLYTLPIALLYIRGQTDGQEQLIMAGAVISMIPVTMVFLFAQRYFVQGVAASGIKT